MTNKNEIRVKRFQKAFPNLAMVYTPDQIITYLDDAKKETEEYYQQNPKSYAVVYGTDLIVDYLNDIISILKTAE